MRICVMTGATHALDSCTKAIGHHQSFTREVATSHLVSPSRLQVAHQSYILEVSHIHLCDLRRSLDPASVRNSIRGWPVIPLFVLLLRAHRRSNSSHAGKRYVVLRRNRESWSRPGNCDSRPRNAISQELTSVDGSMQVK